MLNVTWTPVKQLNRKDIYYTLPYLPHALRVTSSIVSQLTFTGFVPFFRNKFPWLFQDSDWFFKGSKIHINPYTPKISMLIFCTAFHTAHIFLVVFNRFAELSRTSGLFPGLCSPGKCHNKIPGLSRFSRTRMNPAFRIGSCGFWTKSIAVSLDVSLHQSNVGPSYLFLQSINHVVPLPQYRCYIEIVKKLTITTSLPSTRK